ncbi:hypothetical protein ACFQY0_09225 [Haloferula chungangensis]|uniref:Secreted protein n=1 Tax=Haloferula chungangensis TaxID=1048331 RepID=A0ABW2L7W3_9BACT
MKRFLVLTCALLSSSAFAQGPLSEPEREALIDKLKALREAAVSNVNTKFSAATAAFKTGMASNSAALDLYLKCVEKVNYEEKNRSSQDFREWKRRNRQIEDPAFAMALRHQLNWFSLTLRAAAHPGDIDKLAPEASKMIESLLITAEEVDSKSARDELRKPVTNTIFAQAYGLGGLKVEGWPMTPLPVSEVYEKVILPPLRTPKTTEALRAGWINRIKCEDLTMMRWSGDGDRAQNDPLSPQYAKFLAETKPQLIWEMEVDVFKAGDQRGAALRMLEHLENNITHHKATEWERTFRELVDPPEKKVAADATPNGEPS